MNPQWDCDKYINYFCRLRLNRGIANRTTQRKKLNYLHESRAQCVYEARLTRAPTRSSYPRKRVSSN